MDQSPAAHDDHRPDQELIAAANRGDAGAFAILYERYRDWVVALAVRFTHNRETALDVMQDSFLYMLRKFPGFTLTGQIKTFLYPVVRHNALAIQRKKAHSSFASDSADLVANAPPIPEDNHELTAAMESLDPGHREVVILRFVENLSLQEIALAMELPLGTVKSRLHHALKKLRENVRLKDFFPD